jgi:hypothetical protein
MLRQFTVNRVEPEDDEKVNELVGFKKESRNWLSALRLTGGV